MTREYEFLLTIIADCLAGRKTSICTEELDWNRMVELAVMHQIHSMVYFQCREIMPKEALQHLEPKIAHTLYAYGSRKRTEGQLRAAFAEVGIENIIVKGGAIADYYPNPAYRIMGDTDMVLHREDRDTANAILADMGFKIRTSFDDREWQYYRDGMEFEFHDRLVYDEACNRDIYVSYFNDFWKHVSDSKLDWNFHFLFILLHLRKHFMNEGVGLRQFLDIAVLMKNNEELDWPWIEGELKKLELWSLFEKVASLCEKWFKVKCPVDHAEVDEEFFLRETEILIESGVFGYEDINRRDYGRINSLRESEAAGKKVMRQKAMSKLFPSYAYLCESGKYNYLKGRPYLLPLAWASRVLGFARKRGVSRGVSQVTREFISEEKIRERDEHLKQWGL